MFKSALTSLAGLFSARGASPGSRFLAVLGSEPYIHTRNATMPDIDAITSVDPSTFPSYTIGNLVRDNVTDVGMSSSKWSCTSTPIFTWGDRDSGGLGIYITNADLNWRGYYIYHNSCDFIPYKYIWIDKGQTNFVSLPAMFEGRIVRGTDEWNLGGVPRPLGTWFEFSFDANGWIWGDVSLVRGCDGGVLMWAFDESRAWKGYTQWILDNAPASAYAKKPSGNWVLNCTEGMNGAINTVTRDWEMQQVGEQYVYVDDYHGNPVITSTNGRFGTYWPEGIL